MKCLEVFLSIVFFVLLSEFDIGNKFCGKNRVEYCIVYYNKWENSHSGKFALTKSSILIGNWINQYADDLPQLLISIILKYRLANWRNPGFLMIYVTLSYNILKITYKWYLNKKGYNLLYSCLNVFAVRLEATSGVL